MPKASVYNLEGKEVRKQELSEALFSVEMNERLMQDVIVALNAGRRNAIAHTKTRGEVRGGGKKPWRQKGTGRARAGSSRSPIWRGGGITFGPRNTRNFTKLVNKKVRRKALKMALSDKAGNNAVKLVEGMHLEGKTKQVSELLTSIAPDAKRILVVFPHKSDRASRATSNLPTVETMLADSLNARDVLKPDVLVIPVEALDVIEKTYARREA